MHFSLLKHEEDAIAFYEKVICETDDVEIKKQVLQHHYNFLASIHSLEKDYRAAEINRELTQDSNNLALRKIREDSRRNSLEENSN